MPIYWGSDQVSTVLTGQPAIPLDMIYPIGSVYISVNNVSPATLFGGTWEQIKDKFLLSAGDTYANGSTGGSAIMAHTHQQVATTSGGPSTNTSGGPSTNTSGGPSTNTSGSTTLTVSQIPSHYHAENANLVTWVDPSKGQFVHVTDASYKDDTYCSATPRNTGSTGGSGGHTHTLSSHTHTLSSHTHTLSSHTHSTSATTTGAASNTDNMPPYLTVYMWKRTA